MFGTGIGLRGGSAGLPAAPTNSAPNWHCESMEEPAAKAERLFAAGKYDAAAAVAAEGLQKAGLTKEDATKLLSRRSEVCCRVLRVFS